MWRNYSIARDTSPQDAVERQAILYARTHEKTHTLLLVGGGSIVFTVGTGDRSEHIKKNTYKCKCSFSSGDDLLSRAASRQVSSALQSLTTVFGMGTGVTSAS